MIKQNHTLGIFLSFAGYSAWVVGDTMVKLAGETVPIVEILSIGFLVGSIFTLIMAHIRGGTKQLSTKRIKLTFIRTFLNLLSTYGSVAGVIYLSLADFYTIVFTSPLLLTLLGGIVLKERVDKGMWASTIFGFVGVLVAVKYSNSDTNSLSWIGIGLTFMSSLAHTVATLVTRAATKENNYSLSFWPQVVNTIFSILFLATFGTFVYDLPGICYSFLSGIAGAGGVILTNASLQVAPVAIVSPYHYTQIIGGAIAGYLIWHHVPDVSVVVGATMVVASGLYILHAEQARKVMEIGEV